MADPNDASDLYRLDPERFTAARNDLVKRLRARGEKEEAQAVAKLRRPPTTAWALNQIAPSEPELIDRVLDAGAKLRSAMETAVSGDASGLREAQRMERSAVDAALAAAAERLGRAGHRSNDTARQRMASTLRAAFSNDDLAGQLRAGTLDADHDAPGWGLDAASVELPKRTEETEAREAEARRTARAAEVDRLRHRAERLGLEADHAEERAKQAREAATRAAAEAGQAEAQLES